jgi:hypothetical protein
LAEGLWGVAWSSREIILDGPRWCSALVRAVTVRSAIAVPRPAWAHRQIRWARKSCTSTSAARRWRQPRSWGTELTGEGRRRLGGSVAERPTSTSSHSYRPISINMILKDGSKNNLNDSRASFQLL